MVDGVSKFSSKAFAKNFESLSGIGPWNRAVNIALRLVLKDCFDSLLTFTQAALKSSSSKICKYRYVVAVAAKTFWGPKAVNPKKVIILNLSPKQKGNGETFHL